MLPVQEVRSVVARFAATCVQQDQQRSVSGNESKTVLCFFRSWYLLYLLRFRAQYCVPYLFLHQRGISRTRRNNFKFYNVDFLYL